MQRNTHIQQNTPEWLEAKRSTVGGSEIYPLVEAFTTEEERKQYLPFFEIESGFGSVMQTGIKFLYGITPDNFNEVNRDYGNAMELPSVEFFNQKYKGNARAEYTRDFIIHPKYANISCSPDGYIELQKTVYEFGSEAEITPNNGIGLLEIKTIRHEDARKEAKMQYLFQCNWNAWVCGYKWYAIVLSYAKDFHKETDFEKGKRVIYAETKQYNKIYEDVEFEEAFYKVNMGVVNLCKLAFNRFIKKIAEAKKLDYNKMWTVFEFSSNASKFHTEKQLLAQIQDPTIQEQFGNRQATEQEVNFMVQRFKNNVKIKELEEQNTQIEGFFLNAIADNSNITGVFDMFEMKCNKTTKGIGFTPTLRNDKLINYIKSL